MGMEDVVHDITTDDLCYSDMKDISAAVKEGTENREFTALVAYMAGELKELLGMEDVVHDITTKEDKSSFEMELSSFLRELGCPYTCLTEGAMSERFASPESRLVLLDYLCTELMGARMLACNKPKRALDIKMQESPTAAALKAMLLTLGFPKPPENITPLQLFDKVISKVKELVGSAPAKLTGKPMFSGVLT